LGWALGPCNPTPRAHSFVSRVNSWCLGSEEGCGCNTAPTDWYTDSDGYWFEGVWEDKEYFLRAGIKGNHLEIL
jgi:hypothetical protein